MTALPSYPALLSTLLLGALVACGSEVSGIDAAGPPGTSLGSTEPNDAGRSSGDDESTDAQGSLGDASGGDAGDSGVGDGGSGQPDATDASTDAGQGNAGDGGGGGVVATCLPLVLEPSVPAAGALLAEDHRALVFLANGTQWTAVAGGQGVTSTSVKPAGANKLMSVRSEVTPGGRILVQYVANGAPFATFWDGAAFYGTTELPPGTVTVHADAQDRLYALDGNRTLYVENAASAFDNLGALPLSIFATELSFQVGGDGTVHYARIEPTGGKVRLELLRRPPGGSWSAPIVVHQDDPKFPLHAPMLATGLDGSVHVAWWRGNPNGWPRQNFYSRSLDGSSWTTPETVASGTELIALDARTYDTAQGLTHTNGGINAGFSAHWVRRCAPPNAQGWPAIALATDPASYDRPEMRASPAGKPVFLLSAKDVGRVVVRAE